MWKWFRRPKEELKKHVVVIRREGGRREYKDFYGDAVPKAGDLVNFREPGKGGNDFEVKFVCWSVPDGYEPGYREMKKRIGPAMAFIHVVDLGPNGYFKPRGVKDGQID